MKKCKYAGDAADKNCKECNGVSYVVADKEVPATECAGYVESNEDVDYRDYPVDPLKDEVLKSENTSTLNNTNDDKDNSNTYTINTDNSKNISYPSEISYISGISIEHNSIWYKIEIGEKRKIDPNASESEIQEEKSKLINRINKDVDDQVDDIVKGD